MWFFQSVIDDIYKQGESLRHCNILFFNYFRLVLFDTCTIRMKLFIDHYHQLKNYYCIFNQTFFKNIKHLKWPFAVLTCDLVVIERIAQITVPSITEDRLRTDRRTKDCGFPHFSPPLLVEISTHLWARLAKPHRLSTESIVVNNLLFWNIYSCFLRFKFKIFAIVISDSSRPKESRGLRCPQ